MAKTVEEQLLDLFSKYAIKKMKDEKKSFCLMMRNEEGRVTARRFDDAAFYNSEDGIFSLFYYLGLERYNKFNLGGKLILARSEEDELSIVNQNYIVPVFINTGKGVSTYVTRATPNKIKESAMPLVLMHILKAFDEATEKKPYAIDTNDGQIIINLTDEVEYYTREVAPSGLVTIAEPNENGSLSLVQSVLAENCALFIKTTAMNSLVSDFYQYLEKNRFIDYVKERDKDSERVMSNSVDSHPVAPSMSFGNNQNTKNNKRQGRAFSGGRRR